eukprot:TRINITY_DN37532_c0_g1_i1.p1 TRINITY_DN37532_c0_g1~~TRINITY_DN37532_c0_g1_i1.p1  ORF type:complete len:118 (-),score=21.23 TRINITY_DN37532_c0_g1_i1:331-684(-)
MLSVFLRNYRGGGVFFLSWFAQYKSAIWFHSEHQQQRALRLKRRITIAWFTMMLVVAIASACFVVFGSTNEYRYWSFASLLLAAFVFPGQLHVMPSCPWYEAEPYHQKYMAKTKRRR